MRKWIAILLTTFTVVGLASAWATAQSQQQPNPPDPRTLDQIVQALRQAQAQGAQIPQIDNEPQVLSGADIGFRVERTNKSGQPVGTLVVRVNGKWVEATEAVTGRRVTQ